MHTDFDDACGRHLNDAELLLTEERWANADHLFGVAAECGLKRLMIAFSMPVEPDGRPAQRSDRKHVDEIWVRYEAYRAGAAAGIHFALASSNPFADWNISQRYWHRVGFNRSRVEPHRNAATAVHKLLATARRDGLL